MSDEARAALRELLSEHGHGLCSDARRVKALLLDTGPPGQRREVNLLAQAVQARVSVEIRAVAGPRLDVLTFRRLVARLYDEHGTTPELAEWAVEAWAAAIGKGVDPSALRGSSPVVRAGYPASGSPTPPGLVLTLAPDVTAEFVELAAGRFWMGTSALDSEVQEAECPQHEVILSRAFELQTTPVTQAQYTSLIGRMPSKFKGARRPVEQVSWGEAIAYCNALSRLAGLEEAYVVRQDAVTWKGLTCPGYRLPTEAEWEYACRAGSTGARYGLLDEIAWHLGNSGGQTQPVAQRHPNAWGLHDMVGNVWEWVWDCYGRYTSGAVTDPTCYASDTDRVFRGGSWHREAAYIRAAVRGRDVAGARYGSLGFRAARSRTR